MFIVWRPQVLQLSGGFFVDESGVEEMGPLTAQTIQIIGLFENKSDAKELAEQEDELGEGGAAVVEVPVGRLTEMIFLG